MAGSRSILFIVSSVVFMPLCQSVIPNNIDGGEQGAKDTNQADGKCAVGHFPAYDDGCYSEDQLGEGEKGSGALSSCYQGHAGERTCNKIEEQPGREDLYDMPDIYPFIS